MVLPTHVSTTADISQPFLKRKSDKKTKFIEGELYHG